MHSTLQQPINARSSYFKANVGHRKQHDSGNEEATLENSRLFSESDYQTEKMENAVTDVVFNSRCSPEIRCS